MASAISGLLGGNGSASYSWIKVGKGRKKEKASKNVKVCPASSSFSVIDPYRTLRIQPGASESEVKKAFRSSLFSFIQTLAE